MSIKYQFEGFITFKDGKATMKKSEIIEALNKTLDQYGDILEDGRITAHMSREELDKDVSNKNLKDFYCRTKSKGFCDS